MKTTPDEEASCLALHFLTSQCKDKPSGHVSNRWLPGGVGMCPSKWKGWICREARSWSLFLKASHCSLFQGKFPVSSAVEPIQLY